VDPLRSMFAAVFFVTIGCLVDPSACLDNIGTILILSAVVIVGKGFNCFAMSILTGQSIKPSVQTALGLAQIGEFAFMVALLYTTATGDGKSPMYQIVVAVSLITTCLNPLMLKISDPIGDWAERRTPKRMLKWLNQYHTWFERVRNATVPGEASRRIRKNLLLLAVYLVLIFAFSVVASMLCSFDWSRFSGFFNLHKKSFFALAANLAFLTLLKPIWTAGRRLGDEVGSMLLTGVPSKVSGNWRKSVIHAGRNFTLLAVSLVAAGEIAMLNVNLLPEEPEVRIGIVVAILVSLPLAYRYLWPAVSAAGAEFRSALETESRISEQPASKVFTLPGDHYGRYRLTPESPAVGLTIKALDIRAKTGASIVAVVREGGSNRNPGADWCFAPGDEAEAIGSPKELAALKDLLGVISPA
jgi:CPA2 family monovalent cation:H+ antiporter-2